MEYKEGVYFRGKQVKLHLGVEDGKTSIFCGDRAKFNPPAMRNLAKAMGDPLWRTRVMNGSFVDDELKKYTYVGPFRKDGETVYIDKLHKSLKKRLKDEGELTQQTIEDCLDEERGLE